MIPTGQLLIAMAERAVDNVDTSSLEDHTVSSLKQIKSDSEEDGKKKVDDFEMLKKYLRIPNLEEL